MGDMHISHLVDKCSNIYWIWTKNLMPSIGSHPSMLAQCYWYSLFVTMYFIRWLTRYNDFFYISCTYIPVNTIVISLWNDIIMHILMSKWCYFHGNANMGNDLSPDCTISCYWPVILKLLKCCPLTLSPHTHIKKLYPSLFSVLVLFLENDSFSW